MPAQVKTTKSPVALARQALRIAKDSIPLYAHPFAGRDFTQHQLFAILTLRQSLKIDFRGIIGLIEDSPELREVLGLNKIPDSSTLFFAEHRLARKGFLKIP
ncbi:MAG: hypothetical protein NTX52_06160 [Planctomycetota bacterium]|nr:hypothetical protein [Planctomycetota bacterium]